MRRHRGKGWRPSPLVMRNRAALLRPQLGWQFIDGTVTEKQRTSIHQFLAVSLHGRFEIFTLSRSELLVRNSAHLRAMPEPTLAPYPLYDARYYTQERRFQRMEPDSIPLIHDRDVQLHHRQRKPGWSLHASDGDCFIEPHVFILSRPTL